MSDNGFKLKYDFKIKGSRCIIECDGEQHFRERDFFGGKSEFQKGIGHDNIKNQFAFSNNIPLLRIPYIYDTVKDESKIQTFILEFVKTKIIPQEIIDFYSQFEFLNYAEYAKNHNEKVKKTVTA